MESDLNSISEDSVLNHMLARAYLVKSQYDSLKDELERLHEGIIKLCKFDNSNNVSVESEEYKVNIIKRSSVVYDQKLLGEALDMMDGKEAREIFKIELKPTTRDALENYINSNFNAVSDLLISSRSVKDSRPTIKISKR